MHWLLDDQQISTEQNDSLLAESLELNGDESASSFLAISLPLLSNKQATAQNPNDTDSEHPSTEDTAKHENQSCVETASQ